MVDKKQIFIGMAAGYIAPPIAFVIWVLSLTNYGISKSLDLVVQGNLFSEVMSLSAIINMLILYLFLNKNKQFAARGVLLSTISLAMIVLIMKVF